MATAFVDKLNGYHFNYFKHAIFLATIVLLLFCITKIKALSKYREKNIVQCLCSLKRKQRSPTRPPSPQYTVIHNWLVVMHNTYLPVLVSVRHTIEREENWLGLSATSQQPQLWIILRCHSYDNYFFKATTQGFVWRAGWNYVAGRMWPAGHSLETPDLSEYLDLYSRITTFFSLVKKVACLFLGTCIFFYF